MVQLLRSLRRLTSGGEGHQGEGAVRGAVTRALRSDEGFSIGKPQDPSRQLRSTAEQLDDAAALIEGLGMIRQIGKDAPPAVRQEAPIREDLDAQRNAAVPTRRSFAVHAWMEQKAEVARKRASRSWVQRLERALAPIAYPG